MFIQSAPRPDDVCLNGFKQAITLIPLPSARFDFIVANSAYTRRVIPTVALSVYFARIANSRGPRFGLLIGIRHYIESCSRPRCEQRNAKPKRPVPCFGQLHSTFVIF